MFVKFSLALCPLPKMRYIGVLSTLILAYTLLREITVSLCSLFGLAGSANPIVWLLLSTCVYPSLVCVGDGAKVYCGNELSSALDDDEDEDEPEEDPDDESLGAVISNERLLVEVAEFPTSSVHVTSQS